MLANDAGAQGFRNRIINGSFAIDQRNAGVSASTGTATNTFFADRWSVNASGAALTAQRTGAAATKDLALTLTGAASNTGAVIRQRIEGVNIHDLAGKTVTVSFTASASLLAAVTVGVGHASAADNFATVTAIASQPVSITSTAGRYAVSFVLPSGAANGLELSFTLGAMTSGTFALTDVQLEEGTSVTPFERRSYGLELALCHRYFQKLSYVYGGRHETVVTYATVNMGIPMRVAPTVAASYGTNSSLHAAQPDCVIFKAAATANVQVTAATLSSEL
jgi:hypothetical protein